jgi:hypothetical protein
MDLGYRREIDVAKMQARKDGCIPYRRHRSAKKNKITRAEGPWQVRGRRRYLVEVADGGFLRSSRRTTSSSPPAPPRLWATVDNKPADNIGALVFNAVPDKLGVSAQA